MQDKISVQDTTLLTVRRNFLVRALAFTAAGATMDIPIAVADSPQRRVDYHLEGLRKPLQEQFPGIPLIAGSRCVEEWRGLSSPGDCIASVCAEGDMEYAADRRPAPITPDQYIQEMIAIGRRPYAIAQTRKSGRVEMLKGTFETYPAGYIPTYEQNLRRFKLLGAINESGINFYERTSVRLIELGMVEHRGPGK